MDPHPFAASRAALPPLSTRSIFEPWRHRFAVAVAAAAAVLLAAGGLVTSTGSGLAVPDWPLSFGRLFPPLVGGVLFEHGHRMIASMVGLMTLILMIWFLAREPRRGVRRLACAALAGVVAQGLLGGLTVLLRLPLAISVAHACLAQIVFCMLVALALVTSRRFIAAGDAPPAPDRRMARLATGAALLVFVQLCLGAVMRHGGAGLAIPDFPLVFGGLVPPRFTPEVAIHYAHRLGAVLVALAVIGVSLRSRRLRRSDLTRPAFLAAALLLAQIALGAASVLTRLAVLPTTAHLLTGALLLATLMVVVIRAAPPSAAETRAGALALAAKAA
jgi:cytochrome c oxidase assembly protein subunit 15